jgi:asparagine synthase (glutamine-hydrolysing)
MFIFGSELKSLRAHPGLPREIDPRAVEEYFAYGYVPEPRPSTRAPSSSRPATR